MKRLLSILGSISLVSFASSSVVSCKNNSNKLIDIVFKWNDKEVGEIYFANDEENKKLIVNYNQEVNNLICIGGIGNDYIKDPLINEQDHTITFELKDGVEKFDNKQKFIFKGINSNEKEIYISYREFWNIDIKTKKDNIKIIDNVSEDNKDEEFEATYSNKIIGLKCTNLDKYKDLIDVETKNSKITCRWIKKNLIDKEIPEFINLKFDADNAKNEETISLKIIDERIEINFVDKSFDLDFNKKDEKQKEFMFKGNVKDLKLKNKNDIDKYNEAFNVDLSKANHKKIIVNIKNWEKLVNFVYDKDIELEFYADNSKKNEKILIRDTRKKLILK